MAQRPELFFVSDCENHMFLGKTPFIIAEVGSNWRDLEDCYISISSAKAAGASAVKFQLYTHKELYGFDGEMPGVLPRAWIPKLKAKCDECGIDFMCSAFSREGFEYVDPYVAVHKVAMSESNDLALLPNFSKKNIIVSVCQVATAKRVIGVRNSKVAFLYGEPSYPARSYNLYFLRELSKLGYKVGLSDHTLDNVFIPVVAFKSFGAEIIEKHVNFVGAKGPDEVVSISGHDFKVMCGLLAGDKVEAGDIDRKDFDSMYSRRVIATKDIGRGEQFSVGNCGSFRSKQECLDAFPPQMLSDILGKISSCEIPQGHGIGYNQV